MKKRKESGTLRKHLALGVVILVLMGAISNLLEAQEVTGGITGTVTDPSGAAVPGAKVTAEDVARGTSYPTETNSVGLYEFPRLPVGQYTITVESKGFSSSAKPAFELQMNQIARVDFRLSVGAVSETVDVSAAPPLLQTDTMQVGYVVSSNLNVNLPLATRNFVELTLLTPGAVTVDPADMENGQHMGGGGRPYVNGNREEFDSFLMDGHNANEIVGNYVSYQPSMDAIQEFNVITLNPPAQYGQFQGSAVSVTLKSGTDSFHGDLYEYMRNNVLNANNWANNWEGVPTAAMRWNTFGATLGGPIVKHRLFFFTDYEGVRLDNPPSTHSWSVLTPAERAGDFSALLNPTAGSGLTSARQLYNPCASFAGPCLQPANPSAVRLPFQNNQIPLSMIDPVATRLFNSGFYPNPVNGNLVNNALYTSSTGVYNDQGDIKMDYVLNDQNRIWGSWSQGYQKNPIHDSRVLEAQQLLNTPYEGGVIDWTHTFSSSMVMDLKFAVDRPKLILLNTTGAGVGDLAENIGIGDGNLRGPGLLGLNFTNGLATSIGVSGNDITLGEFIWEPAAEFILTHGHHVIHMGFDLQRDRYNSNYVGNNGLYGFLNFGGIYTQGPNPLAPGANTGLSEADFILGLPSSLGLGISSGGWGQRSTVLGAYAQDDWRMTRNLTLNLGLRWQNNSPWTEVYGRQVNFAPFTGVAEFQNTKVQSGPIWGPAGSCSALLGSSNCAVVSSGGLYNSYHRDFEPRIGFAWTPGGSHGSTTVLRGAYSITSFLEGTGNNLRLPLNPPFGSEFENDYTTGTEGLYPGSTLDEGLSPLALPGNPFAGTNLRVWDPNVRPSQSQQWNLSVEHQFPGQMLLSVGYVGEHGAHLFRAMSYFQRRLVDESGCAAAQAGNFQGSPVLTCGSAYLSGDTALYNVIGQISGSETSENQSYNALQVALTKHVSQGLEFMLSYTYSKAMADSVGYWGEGGQSNGGAAYPQDQYNQKADWGPAYFNTPQSFSGSYVYKLPYGTGQRFGTGANPIVKGILGDWQLSGIVTLHAGFPQTVNAPDESGTKSRSPRADCLSAPSYPRGIGLGTSWFSNSSFGVPDAGTFGSCADGTVTGPGARNWDFGISKRFNVLSESKQLEFSTQFINFTNTPIFNGPDTFVTSATFGQVLSSQRERNIQFALKFYF